MNRHSPSSSTFDLEWESSSIINCVVWETEHWMWAQTEEAVTLVSATFYCVTSGRPTCVPSPSHIRELRGNINEKTPEIHKVLSVRQAQ